MTVSKVQTIHAREGRIDCINILLDSVGATTLPATRPGCAHAAAHPRRGSVFLKNLLGPRNVDTWKIDYELLLLTEHPYFLRCRLWGTTLKQTYEKMPASGRRNSPLIAIHCQDADFFTLKNLQKHSQCGTDVVEALWVCLLGSGSQIRTRRVTLGRHAKKGLISRRPAFVTLLLPTLIASG
jgi:hypothetical protein